MLFLAILSAYGASGAWAYASGAPCQRGEIPEVPPKSHFTNGRLMDSMMLEPNARQYIKSAAKCYKPGKAVEFKLMARHLRQGFNGFVLWAEDEAGGKRTGAVSTADDKAKAYLAGCQPGLSHASQQRKFAVQGRWVPRGGQKGPVTLVATVMENSYGAGKVNARHASLTLHRCGEARPKPKSALKASRCMGQCCGYKNRGNSNTCKAYEGHCGRHPQVDRFCAKTCCHAMGNPANQEL